MSTSQLGVLFLPQSGSIHIIGSSSIYRGELSFLQLVHFVFAGMAVPY